MWRQPAVPLSAATGRSVSLSPLPGPLAASTAVGGKPTEGTGPFKFTEAQCSERASCSGGKRSFCLAVDLEPTELGGGGGLCSPGAGGVWCAPQESPEPTHCPLPPLSRLDKGLASLVRERGTDLVVIEGMGRAVHTNYYAALRCECLKLAVIKNSWLAERLGGRLFSVIFKYEVPAE